MNDLIEWTNDNSGFLGLLIFITTILFGWISGIFKSFIKKPKFKIEIIKDATFGSIIDLDREHKGFPVHKSAFAIYLEITNIGSAPSSIGEIKLGYLLSDLRPKWRTSRKWIPETFSKSDFRVEFKDSDIIKAFPFLKQRSIYQTSIDTYLEVGKTANGIVYFEQREAFGSWMPRVNKDGTTADLKIAVKDAFGKTHTKKFRIDIKDADYTLKFSPYFGQTQYEYFINKEDLQKTSS